jgi:hypothetical protein
VRKIGKSKLPPLRLKEISEEYKNAYEQTYNISEVEVCKATTLIFILFCLISFATFLIISNFIDIESSFSIFPFLLFFSISILIATLISYFFNITLYREIRSKEKIINAFLYLFKINFSLSKVIYKKANFVLILIKLVMHFHFPLSKEFKKIYSKILIGRTPEDILAQLITPSSEFNQYLRDSLSKDFMGDEQHHNETKEEKNFRTTIRNVETKIGILFLVGLFFPLIIASAILFLEIPLIFIIFLIPFLLFCVHYLFKNVIKINALLIGVVDGFDEIKKRKFIEFLKFLDSLAFFLKRSSPEVAFFKASKRIKSQFKVLRKLFTLQSAKLLSLQIDLESLINDMKIILQEPRYKVLLDIIYTMMKQSSQESAQKIEDVIKILRRHISLEEKFTEIIKAKKIVAMIFIFLFPFILGIIGGMLPILSVAISLLNNFGTSMFGKLQSFGNLEAKFSELIKTSDVALTFIVLFSCIIIITHYFMKIVRQKKVKIIFFLTSLIFLISFFITLMITLGL